MSEVDGVEGVTLEATAIFLGFDDDSGEDGLGIWLRGGGGVCDVV